MRDLTGRYALRAKGLQQHYLCHWEGYDTDADTWEPHANVPTGSKAKALIRDYNKKLSNDKKREREESE